MNPQPAGAQQINCPRRMFRNNGDVQLRFLLGPAGSGKTYRCLEEIRKELSDSPGGRPLLLIAPKQTTYQLERQLLTDATLPGYTRLQILSFERLAYFLFEQLRSEAPRMLDEEGRLMVLRGLLARRRDDLKLFRASARLTGFARQLSLALSDLQRNGLRPDDLVEMAARLNHVEGLSLKLHDLAALLQDYRSWLERNALQDADSLLLCVVAALQERNKAVEPNEGEGVRHLGLGLERIWVDGFAEFSEPEVNLLAALLPSVSDATLTFCLDRVPQRQGSWLSTWSTIRRSLERCRHRLAGLPGVEMRTEVLERDPLRTRFFGNPVLRRLEQSWSEPESVPGSGTNESSEGATVSGALKLVVCAGPEAEATIAAREILRHVRAGGRYRETTVLVRQLGQYHHAIQRLFSRFEIPFFLDRRESVTHHPLAELVRSALRTVTFQWQHEDWFAALKTGLVPAAEIEIDRLENEALARGWRGSTWFQPIVLKGEAELTEWLQDLHRRLMPPFQKLALALAKDQNRPTGKELASALRAFWERLEVAQILHEWATAPLTGSDIGVVGSVHATVWEQMNSWLSNVELAFPEERLSLREWLPILEAGLSNLTVGVIPPALDQVLVGSVDRSRNPQIQLAVILGLNETIFPAAPETSVLLTESDRVELEKLHPGLGPMAPQHLGRERYHAYVACTRSRGRVVFTYAQTDGNGTPLNPSPFLTQIRRFFPDVPLEAPLADFDWSQSEHVSELVAPLLKLQRRASLADAGDGRPEATAPVLEGGRSAVLSLEDFPPVRSILKEMRHLVNPEPLEQLKPELAAKLYGPVLRTSVSRMEQFAACPFKFFVHSGLRALERQRFELDVREQGTFQHDVLALFHQELHTENKRWRDLSPGEARQRVERIAKGLMNSYREGLLEASEQTRFMARILTESLQDFVETLVDWMRDQYRFDPVAVELPFGEDGSSPAWAVDLPNSRKLELYGRIDRVDLHQTPGDPEALCVVIDYKSSQKQLDPLLIQHGLQLQLLAYLSVLRRWPSPRNRFNVERLIPAGVFYVNLRGRYESESNRTQALMEPDTARKAAYRHTGRFDLNALRQLDDRTDTLCGDQFNYRLTKSGALHKNSREALSTSEFAALLDSVEANLKRMGQQVYAGTAVVDPFKKGATTACEQCGYRSICRLDPWTHQYRILRAGAD
jgi:ATP-dependent helicase/nuclease subunit B